MGYRLVQRTDKIARSCIFGPECDIRLCCSYRGVPTLSEVIASGHEIGSSAVDLDRAQCLALLRGAWVGRVVLSVRCIPVAVAVHLSMMENDLVLATDHGSELTSDVHGQVVSVQADDFDPTSRTAWSVLVTGTARQVTDPAEIHWASSRVHPWVPAHDPLLVKVPTTLVSGRRFQWSSGPDPASRLDV